MSPPRANEWNPAKGRLMLLPPDLLDAIEAETRAAAPRDLARAAEELTRAYREPERRPLQPPAAPAALLHKNVTYIRRDRLGQSGAPPLYFFVPFVSLVVIILQKTRRIWRDRRAALLQQSGSQTGLRLKESGKRPPNLPNVPEFPFLNRA